MCSLNTTRKKESINNKSYYVQVIMCAHISALVCLHPRSNVSVSNVNKLWKVRPVHNIEVEARW